VARGGGQVSGRAARTSQAAAASGTAASGTAATSGTAASGTAATGSAPRGAAARGTARRVVIPLWSLAVLLTSLSPLAAGYASPVAFAVLAACVVLPFGIVALGTACRVPRWAVATVTIMLGALVALVFAARVDGDAAMLPAWRASPAFEALGPLIDAVPRLLTAPRPAPPDPSLLVPAGLLVWIVATAVAAAATVARRAGVAPLLGAVTLHVAGALLTAGRGDAMGVSALATAVVLLLGWVVLPDRAGAPREDRGSSASSAAAPATAAASVPTAATRARPRPGVLLPGIVALVVATFALTASVVPGTDPFEPRTLVAPPRLPAGAANPVPEMAVWSQRGDDVVFTVTAVEGALPERLALATLPDFDGAAWRVDAELRAMGVVAEPDTPPAVATRTATYELTPGDLAGPWVPSAGRATEATGASVLVDLDTGTLVAPGGWTEQLIVTTTLDAPAAAAIGRASVPEAAGFERYLELPRAPGWFGDASAIATTDVSSRWEQVLRIADAVRHDTVRLDATGQERTLDDGARSGSSYARLTQFLTAAPEDGGQVGTSEQFATSFAVLARTLGIPSRVVAGFEVPGAGEATTVQVTGADARVWAEVYLSRVGWVAVDPGPESSVSTELPPPEAEDGTGDDPGPQPEEEQTEPTTAAQDDLLPPGGGGAVVWGLAGGAAALAAAGVVGLGLARVGRRSRWRGAGARGAWARVEDSMRLAGLPVPAGATAPELVAALPVEAAEAGRAVADAAEASAFGPAGGGVDSDGSALDAWGRAGDVERELRAGASPARRLLWNLSPRVWRR